MKPRALVGIAAAVLVTAAATPGVAQADTTYRYWSYWVGGDTWVYSSRGPGFRVPPDAAVEGYRFVVSPKDGSQAAPPSVASTYDQLCPNQPAAPEGSKRVAVVLDFGSPGIAPVGETTPATSVQCVTAPVADNGLQIVQQVAQLRFHTSGLICGIAGFPATECPGQTARTASPSVSSVTASPVTSPSRVAVPVTPSVGVATAAPTASESVSPSPSPTPTPTAASSVAPAPSAVALSSDTTPTVSSAPATPAWIAAIGAAMIAALLGLALLARKGRE